MGEGPLGTGGEQEQKVTDGGYTAIVLAFTGAVIGAGAAYFLTENVGGFLRVGAIGAGVTVGQLFAVFLYSRIT